MVLVDHVIRDPLSHFTYRVLGYSDAAEIFVFVSGLTCGIVYFRLLSKSGWVGFFRVVAKRASRIYIYYGLSSLAIVLLIAVSHSEIDSIQMSQYYGPTVATLLALARDPAYAIYFVLGMGYSPPVAGILLLYLPLTLIAMPLFFWGARHNAAATLCISASLWLIAQLFPQFGIVVTERIGLNPLAWQFIFVIGLFFGMRHHTSVNQPLFNRASWFVTAAWIVVGTSFLLRFSVFISPHIGLHLEWLRVPDPISLHMKETLSPIRVLHFLSTALLFATYIRQNSSILKSSIATPFIVAGQRSLEMFSVTVVLSMATNMIVLSKNPSLLVHLILDFAMIVALTAIVLVSVRRPSPI